MVNWIDFVPGTHGNFLAVVMNQYLSHRPAQFQLGSTVDTQGRYHRRPDQDPDDLEWRQIHAIECPEDWFRDCRVIQITTDQPLMFYALDRYIRKAGAWNLHINDLHIDTWNKLDNPTHRSWQQSLTQWQRFDAQHTDVPLATLREFFYIKFREGVGSGLFAWLRQFDHSAQVYRFPLGSLLDRSDFMRELQHLASWLDIDHVDWPLVIQEHDRFLEINPRDREQQCDHIIDAVVAGRQEPCQGIDVLQQAWVWWRLEQIYQIVLTEVRDVWYSDTLQLRRAFESRP